MPLTGYFIADIAAIKALTPSQRSDGYSRATGAEWYMFIALSVAIADDNLVLMPNDNPSIGRWHKYAANRSSFIADIASIKALVPSQRFDGHTKPTRIGTTAESYQFNTASTAIADDDLVLMPNDNPTIGRWHKYAPTRGSIIVGGNIVCTTGCTVVAGTGKAFEFYAPVAASLVIVPGFNINIQNVADAIRVYRWSQLPNTSRTGQEATPVIQLPNTGGKVTVNINSTYRWISVYARNPSNNNYLDGTCFTVVAGNTIVLLGYS